VAAKLAEEAGCGVFAEQRFRTDALQGLDRLAGEQVASMLTLSEEVAAEVTMLRNKRRARAEYKNTATGGGSNKTTLKAKTPIVMQVHLEGGDEDEEEEVSDIIDSFQTRLITEAFPVFADLFAQLYDADSRYASVCMSHYKGYVKGPPNRPNKDPLGFLQMVRQFLTSELQYAQMQALGTTGTGKGNNVSDSGDNDAGGF